MEQVDHIFVTLYFLYPLKNNSIIQGGSKINTHEYSHTYICSQTESIIDQEPISTFTIIKMLNNKCLDA